MSQYLGRLVSRLQAGRAAPAGGPGAGRPDAGGPGAGGSVGAAPIPTLRAGVPPNAPMPAASAPVDDPFEALANPSGGQAGEGVMTGLRQGTLTSSAPARPTDAAPAAQPAATERVIRRSLPPLPDEGTGPRVAGLSSAVEAGPETTRRVNLRQAATPGTAAASKDSAQEERAATPPGSRSVPGRPGQAGAVGLEPGTEGEALLEALRSLRAAGQTIARANAGPAEETLPAREPAPARPEVTRLTLPPIAPALPARAGRRTGETGEVAPAQPLARPAGERAASSRSSGDRPLVSIGKLSIEVVPAAPPAPAPQRSRPAASPAAREAPPSRLRFGLEQM